MKKKTNGTCGELYGLKRTFLKGLRLFITKNKFERVKDIEFHLRIHSD